MEALYKYCLRLGDNSLVLSHRLAEYSSHGPYLEEDLAISNVALDLLGQAEFFLDYAAELEGKSRNSDQLAYRRQEFEYLNCQLVEQPNTDFAFIMARQFFMDVYNFFNYSMLKKSEDPKLAGIAAKALKEVTYHLKRSSEWIIRLGEGTTESKERIQTAIDELYMYTGELFETDGYEHVLLERNIIPDPEKLKQQWTERVGEILNMAGLQLPVNKYMISGGRQGIHSEHMGHLLAEMQFLQRAYPDAIW